jgi:D-arginine dehydrogenase
MYDFIVIGAGMAGASVGYELARRARVCLIEAEERPGYHSTGRSAALFSPSYGGPEIRGMTRASRAFFDRPPTGFCEYPLLQPREVLFIARSDQRLRLEQMVAEIRSSSGNITSIDVQQALIRVPLLRASYLAAAALDSDAMDIDVNALLQGYLRGVRSAGARLMTGFSVVEVKRLHGVWSIALPGGTVSAPILINAAGALADGVAQLCGTGALRRQPLRRTAILVDAPADANTRKWPAVIDVDEQFYFKPEGGKLLLSPADETPSPPCDAQADELDIAISVDRVQAALNIDVQSISHRWAGLRTFSPDRVPVVGFDPRQSGLFWCAGQGGYGIQTAPAMARTAAALAMKESLPPEVVTEGVTEKQISPNRFVEVESLRTDTIA